MQDFLLETFKYKDYNFSKWKFYHYYYFWGMFVLIESVQQRREDLERRFPVWERQTLASHFEERRQEFADRPLLLTIDAEYTYTDVWNNSIKMAKALLARSKALQACYQFNRAYSLRHFIALHPIPMPHPI